MNRRQRTTAAAVVVYTATSAAAGVLLMTANTGLDIEVLPYGLSFVAFSIVGGVIVVARPDNRIGWLLAAVGLLGASALGAQEYTRYSQLVRPLPLATTAAWIGSWTFFPGMGLMMGVLPLVFPMGRARSRRWKPVLVLALGMVVVSALSGMFRSGPLDVYDEREFTVDNPVGIASLDSILDIVMPATFLVFSVAGVAGVLCLILRFVRGSTEERQQIKWLLYVIGTAVPLLVTFETAVDATGFSDTVAGEAIYVLVASFLWLGVPAAVGIAVLKYRLYDIDLVISRTLVFGGLAAFITAIYVGIVVGLGSLLGAGDEPSLALSIVATAVVAVAFQPARERLTRFANRVVFGHRATPYEVLSSFAGDLAEAAAPERTLERMAKLVADGTGAERVFVWLRVGETMRPTAVWPEVFLLEPIPDRDLSDGAVFGDFDHVEEVVHDGELLGAITLSEPRGEALNHTEHELLSDLAGQVALLLRNLRLMEELRGRIEELHSSRRRLVRAQDDERRRLERDLHDGTQQQLTALARAVREATASAEREGATQAASLLAQVAEDGEEAIRTVQDLAHGIYPPILAAEGLPGALAIQAARAAVPVTVEADGGGRYDPDVEAAVYFCVLEAVNNAAKYARPSRVSVRLAATDGTLTFEVSDDGGGFDPATTPRGHGVTNMADRLDALGGALELDSQPGRGTVVRGALPAGRDRSRIGTSP